MKHAAAWCTLALGASLAVAGSFDDFFIAIRNDNVGSLKSLLQRGLDPNTRNEKGQSGLAVAIQEQSPKAAKLLLEQPTTDIDALNNAGESALMIAAIKGDVADLKLLLARGAKVNLPGWSPLHYAATGGSAAIIRLLLSKGARLEARSPNGSTPLMMAARYGNEEAVDALLAAGADRGAKNDLGMDASAFAASGGRDKLAARLKASPATR